MACRSSRITSLAALLFICFTAASSAQTRQLKRFDVGMNGDFDAYYQSEYQRLEKLCRQDAACWRKEMRAREWIQGTVYAKPDRSAPVIGRIVAILRATSGTMYIPFVFSANDGRSVEWIPEYDWGYITAVYVREVLPGNWIRLPLPGVPNAWVKVGRDAGDLDGWFQDVDAGEMIRIRAGLRAIDRKTGRRVPLGRAPQGAYRPEDGGYYFIERVRSDGWMEFRDEVGADMGACDDELAKDVLTPKTRRYRIHVDQLFDVIGRPLIAMSHPKGC